MDAYDFERAIWQRVLSGAPVQNGESAHAKLVLQALEETAAARRCYAALACRVPAQCQKALQRLCREKRCHEKRLSAVYYLLTGTRPCLEPSQACRGELCPLLRERYTAERQAAQHFREAAGRYEEFTDLYSDLSRDADCHAETLRRVLETLL